MTNFHQNNLTSKIAATATQQQPQTKKNHRVEKVSFIVSRCKKNLINHEIIFWYYFLYLHQKKIKQQKKNKNSIKIVEKIRKIP